jgi:hypothetical protein
MVQSTLYSIYDHITHTQISPPTPSQLHDCYFTYIPAVASDHWSLETPLPSPNPSTNIIADPHNPLLAARIPLLSPSQTTIASSLLQMQTAAAHPQRSRLQPYQDVLQLSDASMSSRRSSDSGSSSSSSSSSGRRICSRCQTTHGEFVSYSLNSYYCKRCAKLTGLIGG